MNLWPFYDDEDEAPEETQETDEYNWETDTEGDDSDGADEKEAEDD